MPNERKRLNCYVDLATYQRLKKILDIMGVTVTDFINQAMVDFIESMEEPILNNDKEAFLQMMNKKIDSIQKQVESQIKNCIADKEI